jgi:TPR repeat protein
MAGKIFISYRRDDSRYQARMIYEAFLRGLPRENVFMDIDTIPLGVDFAKVLEGWVEQCEVLLVLMGPDWPNSTDPKTGKRRLDNPKDFVRVEIRGALTRNIPVVPVLLDGAEIPDEAQLPDDIKGLLSRNAEFVEYRTFDADVQRLLKKLGVGGSAKQTAAPAKITGTLRDQAFELSTPSGAKNLETQGDLADRAREKRTGKEWTKHWRTPMMGVTVLLAAGVIGALVFWSPGPISVEKEEGAAESIDSARRAAEAKAADAETARQAAEAKAAAAIAAEAKSEQARQAAEAQVADAEKARQVAAAKAADAETARQAAETKAADAEKARQAASKTADDAEKARQASAARAAEADKARQAAETKAAQPSATASPEMVTDCDRLAANSNDLQRPKAVPGVPVNEINVASALVACNAAVSKYPDVARFSYELGRALLAAKKNDEAKRLFEKTSATGYVAAMLGLAEVFREEGDYAGARRWWEKAAAAGEPVAMFNIGVSYTTGRFIPRDYAQARRWLQKAVAAGSADAKDLLARLPSK